MNQNISSVVKSNLCIGCGSCFSVCPKKCIKLEKKEFVRPFVKEEQCINCGLCKKICPGINPNVNEKEESDGYLGDFSNLYLANAKDNELRLNSSSGGIASALIKYFLETKKADGIICTKKSKEDPFQNEIIILRNIKDLKTIQGSRYCPSPVCSKLRDIENIQGKFVFIGKPCDIQGLNNIMKAKEKIKERIIFKIGIFCAHTPSSQGVKDLVESKIGNEEISNILFRGNGWPGEFRALSKENKEIIRIPYMDAWNYLCKKKYNQPRCNLCFDCFSEFADISIGDAWNLSDSKEGDSLVITRTKKSEDILKEASRYIAYNKINPDSILSSQPSLINKKNKINGIYLAKKIILNSVPDKFDKRIPELWKKVNSIEKVKTIISSLLS